MEDNENSPAYELGYAMGLAAATWVFDGNTSRETYERVLKGIEDGDPEIYDAYRLPDLSGEDADGMTPVGLAAVLGLDFFAQAEAVDKACEDWEYGVGDGFWNSVERTARHMLS